MPSTTFTSSTASEAEHRIPAAAWTVTPTEYAAGRPPQWEQPTAPASRYLTMRDGCRIAIDVHLPQPTAASSNATSFPTIALFTPYYRRFKMEPGTSGENNPNTGKFRDYFVPRGYAVVVIDVRGTGASFGTRDSFRSPREREDSYEVVDWIVGQDWCNGTVGATGISYGGAASDFLATTGHPAVAAIAPLFSVWDTYADNYFPGGLQVSSLTKSYDDLMVALDHDRRDLLPNFVYYSNPDFRGPQPVDDDPDGELLAHAVTEHLSNFRQTEFMPEFRFREEALPYDPDFSSASFSPYSRADHIRENVAIYSISGWMDGAGYMNGAISRFLTLRNNPTHLMLGPWDHGARIDISPWRTTETAEPIWLADLLRFFDHYLMRLDTGLEHEAPIHYYALHSEQWRTAHTWPPAPADTTLFVGPESSMSHAPAPHSGNDSYAVDFTLGTGHGTRYERIAGINSTEYYPDWQGRTDRMLSYTSDPLPVARELAGHALADLWISNSEPDAALFVYLTEIETDGTERYVTEGLLRALHRKETNAPDNYRTTWPFRTFRRDHTSPMAPGHIENIRIPFLPVAWRFSTGSRIRLSISGADADHFTQVPHGRPPNLTLHHGPDHPSQVQLPITLDQNTTTPTT
ncbi:CocE/NonD family hydrolase [Rhodococcus sp. WS4]|nr:CocE/NonD family hydrolase [Rhodococcus sp. WS4]